MTSEQTLADTHCDDSDFGDIQVAGIDIFQ